MPTTDYQTDLLKRLARPEYASEYLKAALEETTEDGNMEAFLLALKNVVEANGSKQEIANNAGITRQHLYKLLSSDGNPTITTLTAVLSAVGLSIDFKPAD